MKKHNWKLNPDLKKGVELPPRVKKAFEEATKGLNGAAYTPVLFLAYNDNDKAAAIRLICTQTLMLAEPVTRLVLMKILSPADKKATIVSIRSLTIETNAEI